MSDKARKQAQADALRRQIAATEGSRGQTDREKALEKSADEQVVQLGDTDKRLRDAQDQNQDKI